MNLHFIKNYDIILKKDKNWLQTEEMDNDVIPLFEVAIWLARLGATHKTQFYIFYSIKLNFTQFL